MLRPRLRAALYGPYKPKRYYGPVRTKGACLSPQIHMASIAKIGAGSLAR
jgi:hypothetical protein